MLLSQTNLVVTTDSETQSNYLWWRGQALQPAADCPGRTETLYGEVRGVGSHADSPLPIMRDHAVTIGSEISHKPRGGLVGRDQVPLPVPNSTHTLATAPSSPTLTTHGNEPTLAVVPQFNRPPTRSTSENRDHKLRDILSQTFVSSEHNNNSNSIKSATRDPRDDTQAPATDVSRTTAATSAVSAAKPGKPYNAPESSEGAHALVTN